MRPTILEINKKNFLHNINSIKKYVNQKELMPVIKANAYGTYLNKELDILNMFNIVAVAIVDEAIELRNIGYTKDIFILNQPSIEDIPNILKYQLIIGLSEKTFLKKLLKYNQKVKVHLEIETGMNRTGIKYDELDSFIKLLNKNIIVEGIYTHLSSADFDSKYTIKQLELFKKSVLKIKEYIPNIKYIHSEASNGLLNYDDDFTNLVRPGIIMYGYESFPGVKKMIDIKPVATLKTKITFLKEVPKDTAISYSQKYISKNSIKVATIPIGYADGIRRELSNKGYVIIKKHKVPIIGSVCMDSCMIDVTNIKNVKVGDNVYIWDNQIVTLEDIADICHTINYEIICTISNRVPRVIK